MFSGFRLYSFLLAILGLALIQRGHKADLYNKNLIDTERYLIADDDRHNNGPNENDVTDNPTIFGYTRAPSISPTIATLSPAPSIRPSLSSAPSIAPSVSISPSSIPSYFPSMLPSLDACKGYNGEFGVIDGVDKVRVSFFYGIETDMTIQNTLSSQVFSVEEKLLNLLIQQFFVSCQTQGPSGNLFRKLIDYSQSTADDILGLTTKPVDMPTGGKCLDPLQGECNVIEGKMDIYISPDANSSEIRLLVLDTIQSIMDSGLLNDCHPAIISVSWIDITSIISDRNPPEQNDDIVPIETVTIGSSSMWIFVAASAGFIMVVGVITRYRYYKTKEGKDDHDEETESYIEVLSQSESLPSEKQRSTSVTQRHERYTVERSNAPPPKASMSAHYRNSSSIERDQPSPIQNSSLSSYDDHPRSIRIAGMSENDDSKLTRNNILSQSSYSHSNTNSFISQHESSQNMQRRDVLKSDDEALTPTRRQRIAEIRAKLKSLEFDIESRFSKQSSDS